MFVFCFHIIQIGTSYVITNLANAKLDDSYTNVADVAGENFCFLTLAVLSQFPFPAT